jgi:NADH-ubiquinone oxidoreductase chain 5
MLRTSPLLEYGPTALVVTAWLGAATATYAATCGLLVMDLKRVIAFSTCSQLGYMMMAVGLSQYSVGLFHLVTHASFKALLFMAAGSVIHAMADQQDLRRLGGLAPLLPFTYVAILIGSLSLMAMPGLTGYYSKDHLLELAMGTYSLNGTVIYWAGTLAAGLTAFYSIRLIILTFFGTVNGTRQAYDNVHEAPLLLGAPLVFLAVLAVLFGYMAKDLWLGMGTDYLSAALPQHPSHVSLVEAEFGLSVLYKQLPLIMTLLGAFGAVFLYGPGMRLAISLTDSAPLRALYGFINGQWRWNAAVTGLIITPFMSLGYVASKVLDRGIIETVGPQGFSTVLPRAGHNIATYDTSVVTNYALYIVLGFLSLALMVIAPLVLPGVPSASVTDVSLVLLLVAGLGLLPSVINSSKLLLYVILRVL